MSKVWVLLLAWVFLDVTASGITLGLLCGFFKFIDRSFLAITDHKE